MFCGGVYTHAHTTKTSPPPSPQPTPTPLTPPPPPPPPTYNTHTLYPPPTPTQKTHLPKKQVRDYAQAEQHLAKALALDPNCGATHLDMGQLHVQRGEARRAGAALARALGQVGGTGGRGWYQSGLDCSSIFGTGVGGWVGGKKKPRARSPPLTEIINPRHQHIPWTQPTPPFFSPLTGNLKI